MCLSLITLAILLASSINLAINSLDCFASSSSLHFAPVASKLIVYQAFPYGCIGYGARIDITQSSSGSSFAKGLAMSLDVPLIEVNHMQAHILAHFIKDDDAKIPPFPFICLTISGGHTQIVKVSSYFEMDVLGETVDDAVGEAYDKSGKVLGLGYPAGPEIDRRAQLGNPKAYQFTKPKVNGLNFSFSGLKTNILYFVQREVKANPNFIEENLNDICASIQYTIIGILMAKLKLAVKQTGIKHIAIGGGVSANSELRKRMTKLGEERNWDIFITNSMYRKS